MSLLETRIIPPCITKRVKAKSVRVRQQWVPTIRIEPCFCDKCVEDD